MVCPVDYTSEALTCRHRESLNVLNADIYFFDFMFDRPIGFKIKERVAPQDAIERVTYKVQQAPTDCEKA